VCKQKKYEKNLLILIFLSSVFYCCGQVSKSKPAILSKDKEAPKISDVTENQKSTETSIDRYIDANIYMLMITEN